MKSFIRPNTLAVTNCKFSVAIFSVITQSSQQHSEKKELNWKKGDTSSEYKTTVAVEACSLTSESNTRKDSSPCVGGISVQRWFSFLWGELHNMWLTWYCSLKYYRTSDALHFLFHWSSILYEQNVAFFPFCLRRVKLFVYLKTS